MFLFRNISETFLETPYFGSNFQVNYCGQGNKFNTFSTPDEASKEVMDFANFPTDKFEDEFYKINVSFFSIFR